MTNAEPDFKERRVSWPYCIGLTALVVWHPFVSAPEELWLRTRHNDATSGTELTWMIADTARAYLPGIGVVRGRGKMVVPRPRPDHDLIMIVEVEDKLTLLRPDNVDPGSPRSLEGIDMDDRKYLYPRVLSRKGECAIDFIERVQTRLQTALDLSVSSIQDLDENHYLVRTRPKLMNSLVQDSDHGIRARRVAFSVKIIPEAGQSCPTYRSTISTLVEYRRMAETSWRLEQTQELHDKAYRMFDAALSQVE